MIKYLLFIVVLSISYSNGYSYHLPTNTRIANKLTPIITSRTNGVITVNSWSNNLQLRKFSIPNTNSYVRTQRNMAEHVQVVEPFSVGLKKDIQRKLPFFVSDFKDGLTIKSLSSIFYLFFACLAPAIAFGGLLALATGGSMGTVEAVGATAIGGLFYALFSGQPLTIIGTTGPLLAFLKVLYSSCVAAGIPFLPVYAWVGLWSSFLLLLASFFSLSNVVEYFTRFTDDIFSMLISCIFIVEAVKELANGFTNPTITALQAAFSLLAALTTFFTAKTLSELRETFLFPRSIREKIADFAPTIGVLAGIKAASLAMNRYKFSMTMLAVPEVLGTTSGRPWIVDIFAVSNKIKLLTLIPAIMATVLLFMDQNITSHLVMSKKNKLKKGGGFHLDMLCISAITALTSMLGMPWMVGATVRSLAHMKSLAKFSQKKETIADNAIDVAANGTASPPVEEIQQEQSTNLVYSGLQEQRLTGITIHVLIGSAVVFCRGLLRKIPVSVLTGLFLYLGTSSISTTDLWERALLFIADSRDIPKTKEVKTVGLQRVKFFVAIQLALLGSMWWLKGTKIGVLFPVLIGLLAPIRFALEKFKIFKKEELEVLDGEIA